MRNGQQGIALIAALAVMVVVTILVFGSFFTTQIELWVTRNDVASTQAQYIAQTGLQRYKAALFQYFRWLEEQEPSGTTPERTACFNPLGAGIDWERDGAKTVWNNDRIVAAQDEPVYDTSGRQIGSYTVTIIRDTNINHYYTVEAVGRTSSGAGAKSTLRATFEVRNSGILEQAIFAGRGQSNKFINGGTTIRGGIYVVGDEDNPDQTIFNSNGNFSQLNDYDLTQSEYGDVDLRVNSGNLTADNLCANMRVQHGRVELSGSVKLGDPDNKLLSVNIGDDIETDLIINEALEDCVQNKGICSDQAPAEFDLGDDAPTFPTLDSAPNSDECSGANSWRECIHEKAASNGLRVVDGVILGDAATEVNSACATTLLDSYTSGKLEFGTTSIDCSYRDNNNILQGFKYSYSSSAAPPGQLAVYGDVNLAGYHVVLSQDTEYVARTYSASGKKLDGADRFDSSASFIVERGSSTASEAGDIDIYGKLLTDPSGNNGSYPDHVLALVAEKDFFQNGAQVMAPVYAGGTFRMVEDSKLIGSVVADYFCTTGAGGSNANEKKQNSKASSDKCNAGQNTEVVYVNTGPNKPAIMRMMERAGLPTFKVLSYDFR